MVWFISGCFNLTYYYIVITTMVRQNFQTLKVIDLVMARDNTLYFLFAICFNHDFVIIKVHSIRQQNKSATPNAISRRVAELKT